MACHYRRIYGDIDISEQMKDSCEPYPSWRCSPSHVLRGSTGKLLDILKAAGVTFPQVNPSLAEIRASAWYNNRKRVLIPENIDYREGSLPPLQFPQTPRGRRPCQGPRSIGSWDYVSYVGGVLSACETDSTRTACAPQRQN